MAKQESNLLALIPQQAGLIKTITPDGFDVQKFVARANYLVRTNPGLQKCSVPSVLKCLMLSARLNLPLEPALGRFYILPFGEVAQPIIGYKGYIDMATRTGKKKTCYSVAVFKGDKFQVIQGTDRKIIHEPDINAPREDKDLIAVYAVVVGHDGHIDFDWMTKADTDAIRNRSKAKNNGPWITDTIAMRKKTIILRLMRGMTFDVDTSLAVSIDDAVERGEDPANIIDAEFTVLGGDESQSIPDEPKKSRADKLAEQITPVAEEALDKPVSNMMSEDQRKKLFALYKTPEAIHAVMISVLGTAKSSKELTKSEASRVIDWFAENPNAAVPKDSELEPELDLDEDPFTGENKPL